MTNEEIVAHQAEEKRFRETPIGAAFFRFVAKHDKAVDIDQRGNATDHRLREVWDQERAARDELIALMKQQATQVETAGKLLWCCHVRGPDDVYPAPDYDTALKWSDMLNALNWRKGSGMDEQAIARRKVPEPESYDDCLVKAVPALWIYGSASHEAGLPDAIKNFAAPVTSTEQRP